MSGSLTEAVDLLGVQVPVGGVTVVPVHNLLRTADEFSLLSKSKQVGIVITQW